LNEIPSGLSEYQEELIRLKVGKKPAVKKLMCTLNDKKKYCEHYRLLKYYVQLGVKIDHIHRVMAFQQEAYLEPYVNFNIRKRTEAAERGDPFEKELFKLMNNSLYGKQLENVRKRRNISLVSDVKSFEKNVRKSSFDDWGCISDDILLVSNTPENPELWKPKIQGFTVVAFSKLYMYKFFYDVLVKEFKDKVKLIKTDTDSFTIKVETDDIYEFIRSRSDVFDTSNYPIDNPYGIERKNQAVSGMFKDELGGVPMRAIVAVRAKLNSYITDLSHKNTMKGIIKLVKNGTAFEEFLECIVLNKEVSKEQICIRSKKHEITLDKQKKVAINSFDDKVKLINSTTVVPYGYEGAEPLHIKYPKWFLETYPYVA
jgi:hypothetical protein